MTISPIVKSTTESHISTLIKRVVFTLALVPALDHNLENQQGTFFFHIFIVIIILVYIAYQLEDFIIQWESESDELFRFLWYKFLLHIVTLIQYFLTFTLIRVINRELNGFLVSQTILSLQFIRPLIVAATIIFALIVVEYFTLAQKTKTLPYRGKDEMDERLYIAPILEDQIN